MSNTLSNTTDIDPETGFTSAEPSHPSVAQAAKELREAAEGKVNAALHSAEEKFRDTFEKAKEKSSVIKERATESARHLQEVATEKAAALKENATVQAKHLRETACEQWDETRVKAKEIHVTAEDYIRQNPTKCVLGALGAGFLIGLLVRR
jgi:ElaB/YqjD/DUF883 family membrane-anchored ribosome-binding protein